MRHWKAGALSLTSLLALCACKTAGPVVPPSCPKLAPVPASLMQPPETEQKVRAELFKPPPSATPK